jgi:hypothetical protein
MDTGSRHTGCVRGSHPGDVSRVAADHIVKVTGLQTHDQAVCISSTGVGRGAPDAPGLEIVTQSTSSDQARNACDVGHCESCQTALCSSPASQRCVMYRGPLEAFLAPPSGHARAQSHSLHLVPKHTVPVGPAVDAVRHHSRSANGQRPRRWPVGTAPLSALSQAAHSFERQLGCTPVATSRGARQSILNQPSGYTGRQWPPVSVWARSTTNTRRGIWTRSHRQAG